ncbi:MAG: hypothetical protein Hyperionvirus2_56 [Hyperionvirus sp.]|uniref:Uncharacterized protein n=1 Tax=Hyperionvirus sp. TaxID=2487770 RepID=A0A3G5A685_9VIRU|nr:MAG: hypothetical protein Hyperionvirus2_56 [Hyperionvirus sp.]
MSFYQKYLKYKTKYLNIKNQRGGNGFVTGLMGTPGSKHRSVSYGASIERSINFIASSIKNGVLDLGNAEHVKALGEFGKELVNNPQRERYVKFLGGIAKNENTNVGGEDVVKVLLGESYGEPKRECTIEELRAMEHSDVAPVCKNYRRTPIMKTMLFPAGKKGETTREIKYQTGELIENIEPPDITVPERTALLQLFVAIRSKLASTSPKPEQLILDVGGTSELVGPYLTLTFNSNNPEAKEIGTIIEEISKADNLTNKKYVIKNEFPMGHLRPNENAVINYIKNMMRELPVLIVNGVCVKCFKSFFYLADNGAKYIVNVPL